MYFTPDLEHLNESVEHLNEPMAHLNEPGGHLNEPGGHLNEPGWHLNDLVDSFGCSSEYLSVLSKYQKKNEKTSIFSKK